MNKSKTYTGIDWFRFIAAFLVIAIHTSPLLSYSEIGDFILTRIIGRIGVPFFIMTSGFFLISRYTYNADKLISFIKKTTCIYVISIIIYIPINIYNGYFNMDNLLTNIIKDILFDGTMYHLWYIPASIMGAIIAWFIVKKLGFKRALLITSILYVIGLFGDSYYGIIEKIPMLKTLYNCLFEISDYTRNGIFFAPVFFVLGGIIADNSIRISLKNSIIGFVISLLMMFCEGMLLHRFGLQRHDSMYIMLLPCMYFLFNALTFWKGSRILLLRTSALIIYIIHPMVIVVIRMFAKIFNVQEYLIENSIIHYLAVSIISVATSIIITVVFYKVKDKQNVYAINRDRAWVEIDLDNLEHNVEELNKAMPQGCELMAVVKADAYGHGAFRVSTFINKIGVKAFAVATIDEGIELRRYGISGEILILGYTNPAEVKELRKYDLTQTLLDFQYANVLNEQGVNIKAHIKIDTGMHRLGYAHNDIEDIIETFKFKNININGIYTHLCVSNSFVIEDIDYTKMQISDFYKVLHMLTENGIELPKTHIQSSYGLLNYPEIKCDYVRAGISLYGILSSSGDSTKLQLDLRPVLSLKSQIILLREVRKGDSVGYDRAFIADRDSLIGILPIGYADGIPRNLSCENGQVIINGYKAPIIGRVCMDQLAIDVTDIQNVAIGSIATLIGTNGSEELLASDVADDSDTISNEVLSRMGTRLTKK